MNNLTYDEYTKEIVCPEHKDHQAVLYCFPSRFAGIWECEIDGETISDDHECQEFETVNDSEDNYYGPECYSSSEYTYQVCVDCGTAKLEVC